MRVWSFLRSRRLAALLLVGITVYAWVVTLVPLESIDPGAVATWDARHPLLAVVVNALGLHRAYSSPVFIAVVALLTVSTAVCAWERTRVAARRWRSRRVASPAALERLRTAPTLVVDLSGGAESEDALVGAAASLRRLGMRVRRDPGQLAGTTGTLGLMGSPLFHWALVGLFVFAALGQLTRYEGYVDMVAGDTVKDEPATYSLDLIQGALVSPVGFTGTEMTLRELDLNHTAGGVGRGSAALLSLTRGGATLGEQWVYPNSPLRSGPLLIQCASSGPALVGTVRTARTVEQRVVLTYGNESKSARRFAVTDPAVGTTLAVEVTPVGGKRVGVSVVGRSPAGTQTLAVGQETTLAEGVTFTVDALTYYARIQVVNDWTVPWIYAMFVLGSVATALTTFVPARVVRVMVVADPAGARLHVAITHGRSDPAFPRRAERLLREGLTGDAAADATTSRNRDGDA